jgi:hypothetical protein
MRGIGYSRGIGRTRYTLYHIAFYRRRGGHCLAAQQHAQEHLPICRRSIAALRSVSDAGLPVAEELDSAQRRPQPDSVTALGGDLLWVSVHGTQDVVHDPSFLNLVRGSHDAAHEP